MAVDRLRFVIDSAAGAFPAALSPETSIGELAVNLPLFTLFANILAAVKVNDYRAVACNVGRLITTVACQTAAELCACARPRMEADPEIAVDPNRAPEPAEPEPVTPSELYSATAAFCAELEGCCHKNEHIVRQGAASDAELQPDMWARLLALVVDILQKFIKKPQDWKPAPLLSAPVAVSNFVGDTTTGPTEPELPTMTKPSEKPKGEETKPAADEPDDNKPGNDHEEEPADKSVDKSKKAEKKPK